MVRAEGSDATEEAVPATVIGHMKTDGHLGRCCLKGREGDAANVILTAVGHNLRLVRSRLAEQSAALHPADPMPSPHRHARVQMGFVTDDEITGAVRERRLPCRASPKEETRRLSRTRACTVAMFVALDYPASYRLPRACNGAVSLLLDALF